jgi:hypothetical protein
MLQQTALLLFALAALSHNFAVAISKLKILGNKDQHCHVSGESGKQ